MIADRADRAGTEEIGATVGIAAIVRRAGRAKTPIWE